MKNIWFMYILIFVTLFEKVNVINVFLNCLQSVDENLCLHQEDCEDIYVSMYIRIKCFVKNLFHAG